MNSRISIEGVEETLYILRRAEPELLKKLRSDIKSEPGLQAAIASIKSQAPSVSPLSGMNHNGRTAYKAPRVSPLVSLSTSKLKSRNEASLVTISAVGVGYEIIDMVGRGKKGNSKQAQGMSQKLGGKPSRYTYPGFEAKQAGLVNAVRSIIDKYAQIVNTKLR